jgi:hypothetical protein
VIEKALEGDAAMLRVCIDRILAKRRGGRVNLQLPNIRNASDAALAMSRIVDAIATGEITTTEAAEITAVVAQAMKAYEAVEIEQRIRRLERGYAPK